MYDSCESSSHSSVADPNRLCSDPDPDPDPGSLVHLDPDPDPDPNRIRINSDQDPDPTKIVQIFLKTKFYCVKMPFLILKFSLQQILRSI